MYTIGLPAIFRTQRTQTKEQVLDTFENTFETCLMFNRPGALCSSLDGTKIPCVDRKDTLVEALDYCLDFTRYSIHVHPTSK